MDKWKELVNEDVKELSDYLVETFQDDSTIHRFSINHVDPFGYETLPITIDYTLFVNIEKTNRESGQVETFREVSLGSYCNSGPRRLVVFGEQYFDATYKRLIDIVGESYKTSCERRSEQNGKTKRIY